MNRPSNERVQRTVRAARIVRSRLRRLARPPLLLALLWVVALSTAIGLAQAPPPEPLVEGTEIVIGDRDGEHLVGYGRVEGGRLRLALSSDHDDEGLSVVVVTPEGSFASFRARFADGDVALRDGGLEWPFERWLELRGVALEIARTSEDDAFDDDGAPDEVDDDRPGRPEDDDRDEDGDDEDDDRDEVGDEDRDDDRDDDDGDDVDDDRDEVGDDDRDDDGDNEEERSDGDEPDDGEPEDDEPDDDEPEDDVPDDDEPEDDVPDEDEPEDGEPEDDEPDDDEPDDDEPEDDEPEEDEPEEDDPDDDASDDDASDDDD